MMNRLALAALALWLISRACHGSDPLVERWHAPPPHYDYFQSIELRTEGTGEMTMGEGQLVRSEVAIRYRADRGALAIEYVHGSHARPRTIAYRLERGDFAVVEPDYDGPRERHFGCRLAFAENPFPPDASSDDHRVYYACER